MTDAPSSTSSRRSDESIRVIVIDGAGDDFARLRSHEPNAGAGREAPPGSIQRRLPTQAHRPAALCSTQVPVVCVVAGRPASFHRRRADFCIATESARFWEPFAARGFTPDSGGTWLLPRLVGIARAKELPCSAASVGATAVGPHHRRRCRRRRTAETPPAGRRPTVASASRSGCARGGRVEHGAAPANEAFAFELSSAARTSAGMPRSRQGDPGFSGR
jgi:hypothetical protein